MKMQFSFTNYALAFTCFYIYDKIYFYFIQSTECNIIIIFQQGCSLGRSENADAFPQVKEQWLLLSELH